MREPMDHSIRIGSFRGMKNLNKSTILNLIRLHGPISRAELAKLTTLTPPTVTHIVAELLEANLVVEKESGPSTGGRRPILLELNGKGMGGIGLCAGGQRIRGMLATLDGEILREEELSVTSGVTAERYLSLLDQVIERLLPKQGDPPLLGIGVGMHGLVDPIRGISLFAPHLHLVNLPIKAHLEERFGLDVELENDVRAMALAEQWFGEGVGSANVIVLHVGSGIGAGLILEGKRYRGKGFTAGEVGHTVILPDGPVCSCGQRGCLEALASGMAIARRYGEEKLQGRKGGLTPPSPSSSEEDIERFMATEPTSGADGDRGEELLNAEEVISLAKEGDPLARMVVEEAGRYLGYAIVNLIHVFNPERIILCGSLLQGGKFYLDPMMKAIDERTLPLPRRNVEIRLSNLGDKSPLIGAYALILEKLFLPES